MDETSTTKIRQPRTVSNAPSRSARRRSFGAGAALPAPHEDRLVRPYHLLGTRSSRVARLRSARGGQKLVVFLDHDRARIEPYPWSGHSLRGCDPEQGVDEAHARSRVWPRLHRLRRARCAGCVRAHGMRAGSSRRPAVATADPLRRAGHTHLSSSPTTGSGTPFQRRWVVPWPVATEPSLAVKSILVVKVVLSFVSF
jgi:hypothetical protein